MGDPHFGNRSPLTGKPLDNVRWTTWDYALINALQTIEDWTNQHGLLVYEVDDEQERVEVYAKKKIDKFDAAKDERTKGKNYKPAPGEYFIPDLHLRNGADWPTLEEYITAQVEAEDRGEESDPLEDENY